MDEKEKNIVTEDFCTRKDTYNIIIGGSGSFNFINNFGFNGTIKAIEKKKWLKENDPDWVVRRSINLSKCKRGIKTFLGRKHKSETISKMKLSKIGYGIGNTNSQYGTMWITDSINNKKIKKIDIIPEGWYKGRVIKNVTANLKF